jgi:hypothetical protein
MASLLDLIVGDTPEKQAQMSLLYQGAANRNLVGGLLAGNQYALQAPEREMARQYKQAQLAEMLAQGDERKANAAKQQALLAQQARLQAGIPGLFRQPGMTGGEPQPQMEGGTPMFSRPMGAGPMQSAPGGFDVQAAIRLGMDPKMIGEYAGLANIGRPEVARTLKGMKDGREVETQFDKYGQPIGEGLPQYRAPISVNRGNSMDFLDPFNLKPQASLKTFQSPDSVASNAVTMRGQNMTDARARQTAEAGSVPAGYRRSLTGGLEFIPGGPADPDTAKRAGLTEDQGKATGWLVQAENAWKNMRTAAFDKDGKVKSAARPGFNDALAAIPSFGATEAIANTMRSPDRQKFMQASSSLSEALLRAATGAGVNRDEAIQKVRELTPVFGESDETTKQKMESIPVYMEALKVRAGPGAVKANAITSRARGGAESSWDQNDPLGLRQ